ncbi:MAG: hypothetical protein J6K74_04065 [Marinifilaceae bacterium]|nr:hypothetical protein [Marinifilaceae bacterium]
MDRGNSGFVAGILVGAALGAVSSYLITANKDKIGNEVRNLVDSLKAKACHCNEKATTSEEK